MHLHFAFVLQCTLDAQHWRSPRKVFVILKLIEHLRI